nr:PREDICTED: glycolipid transfer protein 3-like [Musa acuminata subsp. malaccensis]
MVLQDKMIAVADLSYGLRDKNPESSLEQVVEETYNGTLKPWHGWISSAAYKVAIKLVPGREMLIRLLMGQEQDYNDLKQDIKKYASVIRPLLDDTYQLLVSRIGFFL